MQHIVEYDGQNNSFLAVAESDSHRIERLIFSGVKMIDNILMSVFSTGNGIGTFLLVNQVIEARKLGYRYLKVSAAKGDDWNGYYTWARLGYSMEGPDHQEFTELMQTHGRQENTLIKLMETDDGCAFWKEHGFWWQGSFDLSDDSENISAFYRYLLAKGINVVL